MEKVNKVNKALICCQPVFDRLSYFLDHSKGKDVSADFREVIAAELMNLERNAYGLTLDPTIISDMKYGLVAFIDECVMYSDWPHRLEWMGRPLQLQFFGEHLAGENFFKKLSELRQAGMSKIDVLEIYYLCLLLGFQGMYRLKGEELLIHLKAGLCSQIETMREGDDRSFEKIGLPQENFVKHVSRTVPFWIVVAITTGIIFLIYATYSFAIEFQLHHVLSQLESLTGDHTND